MEGNPRRGRETRKRVIDSNASDREGVDVVPQESGRRRGGGRDVGDSMEALSPKRFRAGARRDDESTANDDGTGSGGVESRRPRLRSSRYREKENEEEADYPVLCSSQVRDGRDSFTHHFLIKCSSTSDEGTR